jgi:hypothetical protein
LTRPAQFGEQILVLGNIVQLGVHISLSLLVLLPVGLFRALSHMWSLTPSPSGSWDLTKGLKLTFGEGVWRGSTPLPATYTPGTPVEYKYAVASELSASTKRVNPNKVAVPVWETISGNRTVTLQADQHLAVIEVCSRCRAIFSVGILLLKDKLSIPY